jgi:hypothetical protein
MRRLLPLLILLPALAQEAGGPRGADLERLRMARLALDARLRIADLAKRPDALALRKEALATFELALDAVDGVPADAERLAQLRLRCLAMEAQLRIGDTLCEAGREGAREAYEGALRYEIAPQRGGANVRLALAWLAAHQDPDGGWDCDGFMKHDPEGDRCDGPGSAHHDIGVTGLAVLAFLRTGHAAGAEARMGLEYLLRNQQDNGCVGSRVNRAFLYGHAIATLAFCEALRRTGDAKYRKPAQDGLDFLCAARNPYLAWRYEPRGGENDTSLTTWCVMALAAGKEAGLAIDRGAFDGASVWLDRMTDPVRGRVGYNAQGGDCARPQEQVARFPPDKSQAMTAAAVAARLAMGQGRGSEPVQLGVKLCVDLPPVWNPDDGSIDMYYWFEGTEALARVGGGAWTRWRAALEGALLAHQNPAGSGSRAGSWDPVGTWGDDGGRVYSTALMTLALAAEPRAGPR